MINRKMKHIPFRIYLGLTYRDPDQDRYFWEYPAPYNQERVPILSYLSVLTPPGSADCGPKI